MSGHLCGSQLKVESHRKSAIKYLTLRLRYTQSERILMSRIPRTLHKSRALECRSSMNQVIHSRVRGSISIRAYLIKKEQLSKAQKLFLIATESSMKLNKRNSMKSPWTPRLKTSTIQMTHSPLKNAKMQYSKQLLNTVSGKISVIKWHKLH